jgi:hypothetical protein
MDGLLGLSRRLGLSATRAGSRGEIHARTKGNPDPPTKIKITAEENQSPAVPSKNARLSLGYHSIQVR